MDEKVPPSFWLKYAKATQFLNSKSEATPLSNFSPGALKKFVREIAPKYHHVSKEVFRLQVNHKKLTTEKANRVDHRIDHTCD